MQSRSKGDSHRVSRRLTVLNRLGLHARPAAEFVSCARLFRSAIQIVRDDGERFRADRILELLTANLCQGDSFTLEAEGPDASDAVDRLDALMREFQTQESASG
jgi:Phosphotransferase System HPr (HPr) Family